MSLITSDNENILTAALEGLEIRKQKIEAEIEAVKGMLGKRRPVTTAAAAPAATPAPKKSAGGRRNLSEAARRRIAAAQKRRWAEYRKTKSVS